MNDKITLVATQVDYDLAREAEANYETKSESCLVVQTVKRYFSAAELVFCGNVALTIDKTVWGLDHRARELVNSFDDGKKIMLPAEFEIFR